MLRLLGLITGGTLVALPAYLLWEPLTSEPETRTQQTQAMPASLHVLNQLDAQAPLDPLQETPVAAKPNPSPIAQSEPETNAKTTTLVAPLVQADVGIEATPDFTAAPLADMAHNPALDDTANNESIDPDGAFHTSAGKVAGTEPIDTDVPPAPSAGLFADTETAAEKEPEQLHLLWSPFRTEAAAKGFASRLTRVSGVDVRLAEAKPGRYRVGFNYLDEIQKNWSLGQIQARTGLDLGMPSPPVETNHDETDKSGLATAVTALGSGGAD